MSRAWFTQPAWAELRPPCNPQTNLRRKLCRGQQLTAEASTLRKPSNLHLQKAITMLPSALLHAKQRSILSSYKGEKRSTGACTSTHHPSPSSI